MSDYLALLSGKFSPTHDFLDKFRVIKTDSAVRFRNPSRHKPGWAMAFVSSTWLYVAATSGVAPGAEVVPSFSGEQLLRPLAFPRTACHTPQQWVFFRVAARCKKWWVCQVQKGANSGQSSHQHTPQTSCSPGRELIAQP